MAWTWGFRSFGQLRASAHGPRSRCWRSVGLHIRWLDFTLTPASSRICGICSLGMPSSNPAWLHCLQGLAFLERDLQAFRAKHEGNYGCTGHHKMMNMEQSWAVGLLPILQFNHNTISYVQLHTVMLPSFLALRKSFDQGAAKGCSKTLREEEKKRTGFWGHPNLEYLAQLW